MTPVAVIRRVTTGCMRHCRRCYVSVTSGKLSILPGAFLPSFGFLARALRDCLQAQATRRGTLCTAVSSTKVTHVMTRNETSLEANALDALCLS
jgi:hypothetical protein